MKKKKKSSREEEDGKKFMDWMESRMDGALVGAGFNFLITTGYMSEPGI
jgi:hypothetical protein